jgi:hypothetical protein
MRIFLFPFLFPFYRAHRLVTGRKKSAGRVGLEAASLG